MEDISGLYSLVKTSVLAMVKYAIPKNRPITYVLLVPGDPVVELVARTTDAHLIISSINESNLIGLLKKAEELQKLLGAQKVQFLLNSKGTWNFNYLLTQNGGVIGTPVSFSRRAKVLELMKLENFSLGGSAEENSIINSEQSYSLKLTKSGNSTTQTTIDLFNL